MATFKVRNNDSVARTVGTTTIQPGAYAEVPESAWYALDDATTALIPVIDAERGAAVVTSVASSATSVTVVPSTDERDGVMITNASTSVLYLKFGENASLTSYTVKVAADGFFTVPFDYSGRIDGIWAAANGVALVTRIF